MSLPWLCSGGGGATYTWDYPTWIALFPEFTPPDGPSPDQALLYFNLATGYLNNDGSSPVSTTAVQGNLLNLLTAHICQLLFTPAGAQPTQLVGRISNVSEGSVSVGTADVPVTPSSAWFLQTKYGAMFWQMTLAFRTMRYVPGPRRVFNPFPLG